MMKTEAVFHKAEGNMCCQINEEELSISILTGYDVKRVFIIYGDPYQAGILGGLEKWEGTRAEMKNKIELKDHIRWTITVAPAYKRCKYYFELTDGNETYYLFEDGFQPEKKQRSLERRQQYFIFPWMNRADLNVTPDWVKDAVWYQIFPDRFCNGDSKNDPQDTRPWKSETPRNIYRYGGDLQGIIDKLPYLEKLGVNALYLNPVFVSASSHKYDINDYFKIDPSFGTDQTMHTLCQKAHEKGIKIMLDFVFNHCGTKFAPWLDVLENGDKSKYKDWFMINDWPIERPGKDTKDGRFYSFAFSPNMPKLNTNHPEVIAYFCDVCRHWIRHYKIDGLRFDVANEVSHAFLRKVRQVAKQENPEIYLLGEIWHDASAWLQGDQFDAVMHYPLLEALSDFWMDASMTKHDFAHALNRCRTMYMPQTNAVLFNLLDSHDTERLYYRTKDADAFYQQLAVLFTLQGSPCIYYGTEIMLDGGPDPDCRRCMPWKEIEDGLYDDKIKTMQSLIALRKNTPALKSGHIQFVSSTEDARVIEYIKTDSAGKRVLVMLHADSMPVAVQKGTPLFARKVQNGMLLPGGVYICKLP